VTYDARAWERFQPARDLRFGEGWSCAGDSSEITCKAVKRAAIVVVLVVLALYGGDFLWLRYRMATNRNAFGSVTYDVYYTVKLKSGKFEFSYGGQQTFECPHSMFPQYLEKPCWYASRKKDLNIVIDSGDPHNPSLF
jgi:hypothetical protein